MEMHGDARLGSSLIVSMEMDQQQVKVLPSGPTL